MESNIKEYTQKFYLVAGDCNPEKELPLTMLVNRVIEVATVHANMWGIGYDALIKNNHAWVLSRVAVEMKRYPKVNENYEMTTWIESYNRHFSKRNMEITDQNGETIGYVRTVWMIIDLASRGGADIDRYGNIADYVSERACPIEPISRFRMTGDASKKSDYMFKYADCDVNRHVNTVRYVALLLNQFTLEQFDKSFVERFEIAFYKETRYGETAEVMMEGSDEDCKLSVEVNGECHCCARFRLAPRK